MRPIGSKTSLISFDTILSKAELSAGHVLADLGCGNTVFFLDLLARLVGKNGKVFGIDIQPEIIDTVQRELKHHSIEGVTPLLGNLDQVNGTTLENGSLDRAFLINTIHQSADIISMLQEAKRLLKDTGLLIIVDWELKPNPVGPHLDRRVSKEAIEEAAQICKFEIKKSFKPGSYHYGLILANNK